MYHSWIMCCIFTQLFLFSGFVLEPVGEVKIQSEKPVENEEDKNAGVSGKDDGEKDENQAEGIDATKQQKMKMKDKSKNDIVGMNY